MPLPDNANDLLKAGFVATAADPSPTRDPALRVLLSGGSGGIFPTAAAKGDALATPTVSEIGALGQGFNGTTWDRLRTANGSNMPTGLLATGLYQFIGGGTHGAIQSSGAAGDGANGNSALYVQVSAYNGSSVDRLRSIINANNTTGTGILAAGLLAQFDDSSPTTITENQFGNVRMSAARALYVEPGPFTYVNIAAGQATTVVKASAGFLHGIVFNSAATATNITTVYDHASGAGTVIAIPNAVAATVPNTLLFDCAFVTGLTIITTNANGSNMTVIYR